MLIDWLVQQAGTFKPNLVLGQSVDGLTRQDDGTIALHTLTGEVHYTRSVIVAIGRGIAEVQKLQLDSAHHYERSNLHYTVQNLNYFAGKKVLVSGGGNSAVDWALELANLADTVTVVHRQDAFRAMEHNVKQMKSRVRVLTPFTIDRLFGNGERTNQVVISNLETGENIDLEVDKIIISHGYTSQASNLARCGLVMEEGIIAMNQRGETNIPGIFTAGDCAIREGKVRLIAGAFNDAIVAVNSAKTYIEPTAAGMAYVSSHNEQFREKNRDLENRDSLNGGMKYKGNLGCKLF